MPSHQPPQKRRRTEGRNYELIDLTLDADENSKEEQAGKNSEEKRAEKGRKNPINITISLRSAGGEIPVITLDAEDFQNESVDPRPEDENEDAKWQLHYDMLQNLLNIRLAALKHHRIQLTCPSSELRSSESFRHFPAHCASMMYIGESNGYYSKNLISRRATKAILRSSPILAEEACVCRNPKEKWLYKKDGALYAAAVEKGRRRNFPEICECSSECCPEGCEYRTIEWGRQFDVELRYTEGLQWGVYALEDIPCGRLITEYNGTVLTMKEARKLAKFMSITCEPEKMRRCDRWDYMYHCDFYDANLIIDMGTYWSLGRFINHSCEPNTFMASILRPGMRRVLPLSALFALRNIKKGEQITYHYNFELPVRVTKEMKQESPCFCAAKKCRGFFPK